MIERTGLDIGMDVALRGLQSRGYLPAAIYDVGAANGDWTRDVLEIWPNSQFVMFEPLTERQADLQHFTSLHNNVYAHFVGVGDADTELQLGVTDGLWDSSFAYGGNQSRGVPVRRLDSLVGEGVIPAPTFIKIDVQGFEKRVISGAGELLAQVDFIVMECNFRAFCEDMSTLDKTIMFMSERNFIPYEFVDFLRRPLDGAMGQCDILFARADHWLVRDNRWI